MKLVSKLPFRTGLAILALATIFTASVSAQGQEYCSNENTGADYQAVYNIYNSNGACSTNCQAEYAFAIVQYKNCWCSNYIPSDQQDTGSCSQKCPGYPSDLCGDSNSGLFGYIALGKAPLGTAGVSSSTSSPPTSSPPSSPPSTSAPPSSTYVSPARTKTVTRVQSQSPSVVVSYVTPIPTSSSYIPPPVPATTSNPSSTSSSVPPSTTTASPHTTVRISTVSGSVVTQTVTSTPVVVSPDSSSSHSKLQRQGLSGGAIAGIVIGTIVALLALFIAAFLIWRRKKDQDTEGGSNRGNTPKRNTSVLSRTGLLSRGRPQSMSENNYDDNYYNTNTSGRHSMMFGATVGGEGVSPVSPLGSSQDNVSTSRHDKPMVYDQRLNPSALFANHDNGSRVSMQDQQDYSRPLGIANPDLRHSFDSR